MTKATPEWLEHARALIRQLAATMEPFSAYDVWKLGLEPMDDSRSLGAVINSAARSGLIRSTGHTAVNPLARNGTSIREWIGDNLAVKW
jgi:hypothetical protein